LSTALVIQVPEKYGNAVRQHFGLTEFGTPDLPSEIEKSRTRYDVSRLDWLPWGERNNQPDVYLEMLEKNAMFFRAMSVIAAMVQGEGLKFDGRDKAYAERFFSEIGVNNRFLEACSWDLAVLNSVSMRVYRTPRASGGTISRVAHVATANVRSGKPDDYGDVALNYYAPDWGVVDPRGKLYVGNRAVSQQKNYYQIEAIPVYNFMKWDKSQIIWEKKHTPWRTFYPLPAVASAYSTLQMQNEIVAFHLNSLKNGASSTMVLTYPMTPFRASQSGVEQKTYHDEEKQELDVLINEITSNIKGVQNAGKPLVLTYDKYLDPNMRPTIQQFPSSDNDKKWTTLISLNETSILTALGIPSGELIGIPKPTGFSSKAEELLTALEIMRANTIWPLQNILRDVLNRILSDMGISATVEFLQNNPVSVRMTLADVQAGTATNGEYRAEVFGLPPLPKTAAPTQTIQQQSKEDNGLLQMLARRLGLS